MHNLPSLEQILAFKLIDFGLRGTSSTETSMLGGMAHLINFMGTDTMPALMGAREYYDADIAGFSIPASEHSTMTALGREGEASQMLRMIQKFGKPGAIFACVSDGYDIFNAVENIWGEQLKDELIASGSTLVVRPDSGDPVTIVHRVLELLGRKFGTTINEKGFRVLPPCIRVIQGDGINEMMVKNILDRLISHGWSADNIAFGMGGALLQNHTRDDNKWAMKCSAIQIDGKLFDVFKDPITDPGKKSKKGFVNLFRNQETGEYYTAREEDEHINSEMKTVFYSGIFTNMETFDQIRERASRQSA